MPTFRERIADTLTGGRLTRMKEATDQLIDLLLRRRGWLDLSAGSDGGAEQDKAPRNRVATVKLARRYWREDPLAKQAVRVWTSYGFARELTFKAADEGAQAAWDAFWNSPDNAALLARHNRKRLSETLLVDGELPIFLFVNEATGQVRMRIRSALEITEIITDPEDDSVPLYYKRVFQRRKRTRLSDDGWGQGVETVTKYYADYRATDEQLDRVDTSGVDVADAKIMFLKINTIGQRGYPLLTPALAWIAAYKEFMEDRATLTKALAAFAWKVKVKGGSPAVDALVATLRSGYVTSDRETKPTPAAGSTWLENEAATREQLRVDTGAGNASVDGDMLKLQTCAGTGVFLHYFGDPRTGNLATATAMELPMLKQFADYQDYWLGVWTELFNFVVDQAIKFGGAIPAIPRLPEDVDRTLDIDYPPILERDASVYVTAVANAYDRQLIPRDEAARLIMTTLGCNNVEQLIVALQTEEPREKPSPPGWGELAEKARETSNLSAAIDALPEERKKEITTMAARRRAEMKAWAEERGRAVEDISDEEWERALALDMTTEEL